MILKLDLHIHSNFSSDSLNSPEMIVQTARKKGLDGFAITDHNLLGVNFELLQKKNEDLLIIPGIEIWTEIGDIIIYFPWKMSKISHNSHDILQAAKNEGAITVLAHPYLRRAKEYPAEIIQMIDGIETDNSHNFKNRERAIQLAEKFGKICFGGSDAHFLYEIGRGLTYIKLDRKEIHNVDAVKQALLSPETTYSIKSSMMSHYFSQIIRCLKKTKIINQNS